MGSSIVSAAAATMQIPATESSSAEPLRLVCSEVWGGNRPIHRAVELPGIQGILFSQPCEGGRGGDVHYMSVCGAGILSRMCLADVVGHGEAVAAISDQMHAHMRRSMNTPDQRRVLGDLNTRLEQLGFKAMTTAAALTYYTPTRNLAVSYAGHPPGWIFSKADRRWTRLELDPLPETAHPLTNGPLAIEPQVPFTRKSFKMQIGNRMVLVTDGVLEAPDASGELFGDDRMQRVLDENRGGDCAMIGEAILSALAEHRGDSRLDHDDVTFLVAEIVPGPSGPAFWNAVKNLITRPRGNSDAA